MVETILIVLVMVSFLVTFLIFPYWIKKAKANGLVGRDVHKTDGREVAEGGGIPIIVGISTGILLYVGVNTFVFNAKESLTEIFVLLSVFFLSSMTGIIDDLLGWRKGLGVKTRLIIISFAAIPLMVINAGSSVMHVPFLGGIDFGLLYPLLIIPVGVVGATTTFNILAGYNGLEAGQGIIMLSGMAFVTYVTGKPWLALISLIAVASLCAFYVFNRHPSKVFPGDIMTYSIGALMAAITILGNVEKIAVLFFIPYIVQAGLKLRGRLEKHSFGKLNEDGSLEMPYDKIYGLEHLAIKILKKIKPGGKVHEKDVVFLINGFQAFLVILVIASLLTNQI